MHPFRRTTLAVLAAAALVAAACGDDDTTADDTATDGTTDATAADDTTTTTEERTGEVDQDVLDRIADASAATVDQGTARFTITAAAEGTGGADGTSDIEVDGEVDFDEDMRQLTFTGPEGDLGVVFDGSMVYVELPATEDDDWVAADLDELFDGDVGVGGPGGIPFQDPADNLRVLQGSATEASELGAEQVDGEDTTQYRVFIDLTEAADEAHEDVEEATRRMSERSGVEELEMQVWIDGDDLIRRIEYRLDLGQARITDEDIDAETDADVDAQVEADPEGLTIVTIDYRDFGTDVDIEVPDDDQVIDIDEDAIRDAFGEGDASDTTGTGTTSPGDDESGTTTTDDDGSGTTTTTTSG